MRSLVLVLVTALTLTACTPGPADEVRGTSAPGDGAGASSTGDGAGASSTGDGATDSDGDTTTAPAGDDVVPGQDDEAAQERDRLEQEQERRAQARQERAREIVAGLSVHEKSGLVVVAAHQGAAAPVGLVVDQHLGGIIVMDPTLTTGQLAELNTTLARATQDAGRDWPVFLGVDQEGGTVERAKDELTRFPTFLSYGAADDPGLTRRASAASGAELRGVGLTVNFAPDADVTVGPGDPTIGSRSAGSDPDLVARHAVAAAQGYLDAGILPVVKHFPGHGSVPADSHLTLPVQTRSLDELRTSDLVPFAAAVEAGLPAVMMAHLQVEALGSTLPSSLEPEVVQGLLRDDLGFDGLVVTDAVDMAAVADRYGSAEAAVQALVAGADVILMPLDPVAARTGIEAAVEEGRLDEARLDEALGRQISALLRAEDERTLDPAGPGAGGPVSSEVSAAAVTLVAGDCDGPLVDGGIVPVGDAVAVDRLTRAAERAGLPVGQGAVVELLGAGQQPGGADVTVAMDTPYVLGRSTAPVRIALYGDTPGAMQALVGVLSGVEEAPGRLPVEVDGVERAGC